MAFAGADFDHGPNTAVVTAPKTVVPITMVVIILRVATSRLEGPQFLLSARLFCPMNSTFIVTLIGPSCCAAG